jgi:hypothetical protein
LVSPDVMCAAQVLSLLIGAHLVLRRKSDYSLDGAGGRRDIKCKYEEDHMR